jgi:ribose 5-phosphate isomerase A
MERMMSMDKTKINLGTKAAEIIEDGMVVGLGTGSTAACFIDSLIERCKKGLKISGVATSNASEEQARKGGIPVFDIDDVDRIDITVDGADNVDAQKRLVKGLGGALLREKIVAHFSDVMLVIVDESKISEKLEDFLLPVEIAKFGWKTTLSNLAEQGYGGNIRENQAGDFFLTDNGNYIVDIRFIGPCEYAESDNNKILAIPGVFETGFFFGLADRIFVGKKDGEVEIRQ